MVIFILYSIDTTQLYSNLVYIVNEILLICALCWLSLGLQRSLGSGLPHCALLLCWSVFSTTTSTLQQLSLASIPLLLILEDKGGPTHGH